MIGSNELQEIVDSLAERLQRSVAVDDREIRLIVASRHFGDEDPVRVQSVLGRKVGRKISDAVRALGIEEFDGPGRIGPLPEFDAKARVCVPVRCAGLLLGYLWLIDDDALTDEAIADAASAADAVGLILYRRDLASERRRARHDALLRDLLSADLAARAEAVEELYDEGVVSAPVSVAVIVVKVSQTPQDGAGSTADEIESALAQAGRNAASARPDGVVLTLTRRRHLVLLVCTRTPLGQEQATGMTRRAVEKASALSRHRSVGGIGTPRTSLGDARLSFDQAMVATRAAEHLPGLGDVLLWESLGVYALLAKLTPQDLTEADHPAPLMRLAESRNSEMLMSTAEMFLDLAGDAQRTARSLHIHRATLYQRLARIEELTGLNLKDGVDRLTLHLGLKLARLTGTRGTSQGHGHRQM